MAIGLKSKLNQNNHPEESLKIKTKPLRWLVKKTPLIKLKEEKKMALISLTEWAKREGITARAARYKASRGLLETAQKIGRNWVIDEMEKNRDNRRKDNKMGAINYCTSDYITAEWHINKLLVEEE